MATVLERPPQTTPPTDSVATSPVRTAGELAALLGVPAERLVINPAPGTATAEDCARCERPTELIDGTLVEKPVNNFSSAVAFQIAFAIQTHALATAVSVRISGADGSFRMSDNNLRLPDIAVTRAERLSGDQTTAVPDWVPDLAIEVLSPGNTAKEMSDKRSEYFASGVTEVWESDPLKKTGRVFRENQCVRVLSAEDSFEGGDILPGFAVVLGEIIDAVPTPAERSDADADRS